jgi:aspartate/tyrosine/aromatic aminotransferase
MFETVTVAPPDPILGITDAFNADPNPKKINLSVGVYKDAAGKTPVLPSVKEAEKRILTAETNKSYMPISGDPKYGKLVLELLFGADHDIVKSGRGATAHCPGGTGALRVAADYIAKLHGKPTVYVSDPTWANHNQIFEAAGLKVASYPYFDKATNGVAFDALMAAMDKMNPGDVVLLHGCCHNPTGADPNNEQWTKIGQKLAAKGLFPVIDFAYQGFGSGLNEDAEGLRELVKHVKELLICSSFSKNFGLYNERVGALTIVGQKKEQVDAVFSQVKVVIRANFSNPPAHGSNIVVTILGDPQLRAQWESELAGMRDRINGMRKLFVDTLARVGVKKNFEFIIHQRGMFSFSGLTKGQVERLKKEYAIYIVGSGRINVAGMTTDNMEPLCKAIASVM